MSNKPMSNKPRSIKPESIRERLFAYVVSQFQRPRGLAGHVVGRILATRPSNLLRTQWAIERLDVQAGHHVLEIGFGPGIGIASLVARVGDGVVWGIDHSGVMVRTAARRNRAAVADGRVRLIQGSVEHLPDLGQPLDRILAVNNAGMWPEPEVRLRELRDHLRPGGVVMLVNQPRQPGATADDTRHAARELTDLLAAAGFTDLDAEYLESLDPPAAAVRGARPVIVAAASVGGSSSRASSGGETS
jgi:SAM-dependent methyltransferase